MKRIFFALALLAISTPARADKAIAEAAYAEGKRLAGEGNYEAACPKFQTSYDEDPQIGVLLNLADCHERIGKLASAWAEFREAAEQTRKKNDSRNAYANERADALAPKVSHLVIRGPAEAIDGLVVRRDGKDITGLLGDSLPTDPGEHTVSAEAPGREPWETKVTLEGDADSEEVQVPPLAKAKKPPPGGGDGPREIVDASARNQRRLFAAISGGVGLIATGVGLFFGNKAFTDWDASRSHCPDNLCDDEGRGLVDSAQSAALGADIFIGIGIAGLAAGAVLWLTAPDVEHRTIGGDVTIAPVLTPHEAGVQLGFEF